jgi:hypothetical protein
LTGPLEDWDLDPEATDRNAGAVTDRLDRAAVLCRRDPLRGGNVIQLPAEGDVVVLGDLHGDLENFNRVVKWAGLHLHRDRYLVLQELIHGGPEDGEGGDLSFRLLEEAATLKCRYKSQVQVILSNHDLGELLGAPLRKSGKPVTEMFRTGLENTFGARWREVHEGMKRFLASLPLAVRTPDGVLISHSTPEGADLDTFDYSIFERPLTLADYQPGGSVYKLVWGRHHNQACADRFANALGVRALVTGHQSSMPGLKMPTSRHVIITSDGPLGTMLVLPLNTSIPAGVIHRQVRKVRSLRLPNERSGRG